MTHQPGMVTRRFTERTISTRFSFAFSSLAGRGRIALAALVCCMAACGPDEPVAPLLEELYQAVSLGSHFTCGLRLDGSVRCWGQDAFAEMKGMLDVPKEGVFTDIASGYYGNCGLRNDGCLKCWGRVDGGSKPFQRFSAVEMASTDICGLRQDGKVRC